jgi:hypothetical protein
MAENEVVNFDAFESWLRTCPAVNLPVELLDRCLSTIPGNASPSIAARPTRHHARAAKIIAGIGSIVAVTVLALFLLENRQHSVFAQVIEQTTHATAIHILETFSDPERSPEELRTSEWWVRPGIGMRRILKVNGEVEYIFVKYRGETINWLPRDNSVVIKQASDPVGDLPYFTNAILALKKIEQMANEQRIPVSEQHIAKSGSKLRRFEIKNLREDQQNNATLMLSIVVDIDDVTNRIVRNWSHEWAVGKDRDNFATLNATHVMEIDYPETLPESLFKIDYPTDAKVTRTKAADRSR